MIFIILILGGLHLVALLTAAVLVTITPGAWALLLRPRPKQRDNPPLARWANQYTRIER